MKKIKYIAIAGLSMSLMAGCTHQISPDVYESRIIGEAQTTHQGVIISARSVSVNASRDPFFTTAGAIPGAIVGGFAGSAIGAGTGRIVAITGGALAGSALGGAIGDGDYSDGAMEYVVRIPTNKLYTVVQGNLPMFTPGDRVFVIISHKGRSRVTADRSGLSN